MWLLIKETWLKSSKHVCGMTKTPPRHNKIKWCCETKGMSEKPG